MRGVTRASAYASTMELFLQLAFLMCKMCSSHSHIIIFTVMIKLNIQVNKEKIL